MSHHLLSELLIALALLEGVARAVAVLVEVKTAVREITLDVFGDYELLIFYRGVVAVELKVDRDSAVACDTVTYTHVATPSISRNIAVSAIQFYHFTASKAIINSNKKVGKFWQYVFESAHKCALFSAREVVEKQSLRGGEQVAAARPYDRYLVFSPAPFSADALDLGLYLPILLVLVREPHLNYF